MSSESNVMLANTVRPEGKTPVSDVWRLKCVVEYVVEQRRLHKETDAVAVSPTNNVRMDGGTSPTDDVQRQNLMCSRTRPEFDDSCTKTRTDAACTSPLTNVHRKDKWINSSTSFLHVGILTTASHVCSRRHPFAKNENVCTSQIYVACALRLLETVIHAGHIVLHPHLSTQVSVELTAVQVWCTLITGKDASWRECDLTIRWSRYQYI